MGLMGRILTLFFGDGRNAVARTAEVFRENAEAGAQRQSQERNAALSQFDSEFSAGQAGLFDRIMDAVNRLPRPAMALGTLGLFVTAMVDPVWFAARMQGIALVPEPLWWLLGVIVSFYFGARHQFKGQAFRSTILRSAVEAPRVAASIAALERGTGEGELPDPPAPRTGQPEVNRALRAWREQER